MGSEKRPASVSLDLDNRWSYLKTRGHEWEHFPSYLDTIVPRILDFLDERDLTITFFVVGQDAALEKNHAALRSIAEAGHEIGNHSFNHEPWLHLYTEEEIEAELSKAQQHIEQATGFRPVGFRGPGYSLSLSVLRVLKRMGYAYDCSTFPTYLGPLSRIYLFMTAMADLSPEEKKERSKLFGTFQDGLRPIKPYFWQMDEGEMVEIPVTTMPIVKVPIHVSYLLYLNVFSKALAINYFRMALLMCRLAGVEPSLLLHPTDFMDLEDAEGVNIAPGLQKPVEQKLGVVSDVLAMLAKNHRLVTMREHAQDVAARRAVLPLVEPNFSSLE